MVVSSNGYLAFGGSGTVATNTVLPAVGGPVGTIAPFWDDLNPASRGTVYVQDMGDGRWIAQWDDLARFNDVATSVTFQAILFTDGTITFQYETMTGTLNSATIGIESPDEGPGVLVASNSAYASSSKAVRFTPPARTFAADLEDATLEQGESSSLTLAFDATGLEPGTYDADLTVTSNATNQTTTTIPLVLEVGVAGAIAGDAGWRLVGPPSDLSVADLAGLNLVQGIPGQFPNAQPNVLTYTSGSGWAAPPSSAAVLPRGQGLAWYFFDQNLSPDASSFGGGTGSSVKLPMGLLIPGTETADVEVDLPDTPDANGERWALLANPFGRSLRLSALDDANVWPGADGLASSEAQVYDPSGPTYVLGSDAGSIEPWQAFWVLNASSESLTIPAAETEASSSRSRQDVRPRIVLSLHGATASGAALEDRAATVVFDAEAEAGPDRRDAPKLVPFADAYVLLGARVEGGALQSLAALPDNGDAEVEFTVRTVGAADTLTVRWPRLDVPDTWSVTLRDLETGLEVDLRTADSYSFTAPSTPARLRASEPSTPALASSAPARFVLTASARATDDESDLEAAWSLAAGPNPSRGAVAFRYEVPAGPVRLALYDVLGREVAVLEDGPVAAGSHRASVAAGSLAPGVYVARLTSADRALTRTVTIVR